MTRKSGKHPHATCGTQNSCFILIASHHHTVISTTRNRNSNPRMQIAQSAGAVEYTDCTSSEG